MMRRLFLLLAVALATLLPAWAQDKLAIVNATLIDGSDHPPRQHATVLVQGGKIISITDAGTKPPIDAQIVDGSGRFLVPGLWNNDLHGPAYSEAKAPLLSLVSYGITTIRDMGAPLDDIVRLRNATASGALVGPRLFIAGPLLQGPIPIQMALIVDLFSEAQAREEVRNLRQHNVDYIEVDTSLPPTLYWAIADEAKRQNIPFVGHIPAKISARDAAKANQTDVEHLGGRFLNVLISCSSNEAYFHQVIDKTYDDMLVALKENHPLNEPQFRAEFDERLLRTFDEKKAQKLYHLYATTGIAQTPTLYALKNSLWQGARDRDKLSDRDMEAGTKIFAKDMAVVGAMKRAGMTILAGTDGPYPQGGDELHSELELLVQAGLTPLQALQAASRDAANAMGVLKETGTIEVGQTADLVLLDADPLAEISNTRKIDSVILHGRLFSKDELAAMRNH